MKRITAVRREWEVADIDPVYPHPATITQPRQFISLQLYKEGGGSLEIH